MTLLNTYIAEEKQKKNKPLSEIDVKQQIEKVLQIHPETKWNKRQLLLFCLSKLEAALNLILVGH